MFVSQGMGKSTSGSRASEATRGQRAVDLHVIIDTGLLDGGTRDQKQAFQDTRDARFRFAELHL
jgi:hypothetical protein